MNTIISRYLFKEICPPFFLNLLIFCFIFLMAEILDITRLILNYRMDFLSVVIFLIYSIPSFLVFVFPMAVMLGIMLCLLRMGSDNEIISLRAGGVSMVTLLPPVLLFCALVMMMTAFITFYASPSSRLASKQMLFDFAASNITIGIEPGKFNDQFKGIMIYVNQIDRDTGELQHIFIQDQQDKKMERTITASRGTIGSNKKNELFQLQLKQGVINHVDRKNRSVYSIHFDQYVFNINYAGMMKQAKQVTKSRKEMTLWELNNVITALHDHPSIKLYIMTFHQSIAIPVACFILGILAFSLGLQPRSPRKSQGVMNGLLFFLIYYILLSTGTTLGEAGKIPPWFGVWMPNIIIGIITLYLLTKTIQEKEVKGLKLVEIGLEKITIWLKKISSQQRKEKIDHDNP